MKELLEKVSKYQTFNYLLPGTVFAFATDRLFAYSFMSDNIIVTLFICYFLGLVVSRVGSIILEPALRKVKIVKFAPYSEYLRASKVDPKVEVLSESNNMYRTLCSVFFCLLLLKGCEAVARDYSFLGTHASVIAIGLLFVVFMLAYRKQTGFVVARICEVIKSEGATEAKVSGDRK